MTRTYKYPLLPNASQELKLLTALEACRQLYNACLQQRIEAYKRQGKTLNKYDQQKELTQLRQSDQYWSDLSAVILRSAIARLDEAYKAFFRRVKRGEEPGFPRFRGYGRYDSFDVINGTEIRLNKNRVLIPNIGHVKFNKYRDLPGKIRACSVSHKHGKWTVSFVCELGQAPSKVPVRNATAIDLGIKTFAVLSDGTEVPNPHFFKKSEELLASRQQALSRKLGGKNRKPGQRNSKSYEKAKLLVGKAHEHVANQRLDHARKLACELFKQWDLVAYEDLAIKKMIEDSVKTQEENKGKEFKDSKDRKLVAKPKNINDVAWGSFIQALVYKAENAGKHAIPVDPKGTTQQCSDCGVIVAKGLGDRTHSCPHCGLVLDRDHNAARNILRLGLSLAEVNAKFSGVQ